MGAGWWLGNALVLGGIACVLGVGIETQASPLLAADPTGRSVQALEDRAARSPETPAVVDLATAYLERDQPGLATAVIERASSDVRQRPEVEHLYARALFGRGRVREALAVARDADGACAEDGACPAWLVARTTRQLAFLEEVVAAGIDDPYADPDATLAAFARSSREVRVVAMR